MPSYCLRGLPEELHERLKKESHRRNVPIQKLLLETVEKEFGGDQVDLFDMVLELSKPEPTPGLIPFTFIDLFAGVGGFRVGMEALGGKCVFTSEWDVHAQKTYKAWHGDQPHGDITQVKSIDIPDHDILCAGFPCQPFSLAGVSKKNSLGRSHGFACETQGTLFFHLATIAELKRPPVMILENVKNLKSHDGGNTWKVIERTLKDLKYKVFAKIIDAKPWVPQHRERIFIVCFDEYVFGTDVPFEFPTPPETLPKLKDILEKTPDPKYTLSDHLWTYLQNYAAKHAAAGNGFGFGLADLDGSTRTLSARYHKDGSEILIPQGKNKNPRRLTPDECKRLMGYPDRLKVMVSDTQAYRQFGNSVVPAVVEAVGRQVLKTINWHVSRSGGLFKARPPFVHETAMAG
ncbi:MAG: DNA (cytosine-5-)-methyltransferase [Candidatus Sumerlaeaceae bacterium]